MKSLAFIHRNDSRFAVGDFYPVLSIFSYHELGNTTSPFLLLDHLGPGTLKPTPRRGGVNDHPHRGFETVTIVFAGEVEHTDSTGGGGIIGTGDVQWMTAGAGIIHRELFSEQFSRAGGYFEMIQLWVNLPAADKMTPAKYQSLTSDMIPQISLPDSAGTVRVIAGEFNSTIGPAQTHLPITVLDVQLVAGHRVTFPARSGDTTLVYLRSGRIQFAEGDEILEEQGMAVMSSREADFELTALKDCQLLILVGEPLNEPISGRGPFVMNTYEEILQGYEDLKSGQFVSTQPAALKVK
jgi:redox-sensitive bicupin YhaK (pirin superfamily)